MRSKKFSYSDHLFFIFVGLCAFLPVAVLFSPPRSFTPSQFIEIPQGESVQALTSYLKDQGLIRFSFPFRVAILLSGHENSIQAGNYFFSTPLSIPWLISRIENGQFDVPFVHVTIPEGSTVSDMPNIIGSKLTFFNTADFLNLTKGKEGYLFPDTYYFPKDEMTKDVIGVMEDNFNKKVATIQPQITAFGKPLADVVIMASILEKEARTTETRRIIAGILWKRLQIGMPLELDTTLEYVLDSEKYKGLSTYQFTSADLANPTPYNTYLHKGLPPTPIANPGLDALTDAVTPISTPYLYFLSDTNGVMHYSTTFAQHQANIAKYLN